MKNEGHVEHDNKPTPTAFPRIPRVPDNLAYEQPTFPEGSLGSSSGVSWNPETDKQKSFTTQQTQNKLDEIDNLTPIHWLKAGSVSDNLLMTGDYRVTLDTDGRLYDQDKMWVPPTGYEAKVKIPYLEPSQGWDIPEILRTLAKILEKHTTSNTIYYYVWDGFGAQDIIPAGTQMIKLSRVSSWQGGLLTGPLSAIPHGMPENMHLPKTWEPIDKEWYLGSAFDYPENLYLVCSQACADDLLANETLNAQDITENKEKS